MGSPSLLGASRGGGTKLQNKLKLDKSKLSYADLHSEVVNDVKYMHPTSPSCVRKQRARVEATKREVFVKNVSKSPIYLDKEIPLDIGVIDWRSLEDWQYYHPKTPISTRYSSPSSITPNYVDASSNRRPRGRSSSPLGRKGRRPTLQSYLDLSTSEGHLEFVKSSWKITNKFQDIRTVPTNSLDGHGNILQEFQFFNKKIPQVKLKECNKKILDHNNIRPSVPKTKTSRNVDGHKTPSHSKGRFEAKYDEYMKISKKLLDQSDEMPHLVSPDRHKKIVLLMPRDSPGNTGAAISRSSETNCRKSTEHSRMSLEGFHFEKLHHTDLCSNIPHSLPPQDIDGDESLQEEQHVSADTNKFKFFPSPPSKIKSVSPPKTKFEEVKTAVVPKVLTVTDASRESDMKIGAAPTTKVRNASPKRLLGIGLSKIGITANSKNSAVVPQFGSKVVAANSGVEGGDNSSCSKSPTSHIPDTIRKDRASPLRRLLDPLLKPKAAKALSLPDQSNDYSTSSDKVSTSFHVKREPSSVHSTDVNSDLTDLRASSVDVVHHRETRGSSTIQAYIKVAVKNNLPLFTFTVDDNSVVLAATVKKFSLRKDDTIWIHTFFKIHETKKSVGWLNYGPKNKEYIPNAIAQMKVSDLQNLDSGGKHLADELISKEYVLYAADLRLFDKQPLDVQPNDELAAIVVKPTRKSTASLTESLPDFGSSSNVRGLPMNKLSVRSHKVQSMTVILPGGAHGMPSKGEPSSLIERWLSGGLCDCGGWDLGCMVKVLGNQCQNSAGQFELFSQSLDEVSNRTPFFALSSLNSGIFLVKFDSSISLLQAFSISIAAIDSRKPSGLQQPIACSSNN
ncbi:hypothetical protein POM88_006641 [Heracleum sosnowskyi]|uniref:Uncharacterized protein n=1 Tax=Heracleum sosnowskyi TaxID=360622 RepID=A0AAD8J581_9APIA|nr:hypothetical protein POM88_006641 [Heracleum sosnowskyi]